MAQLTPSQRERLPPDLAAKIFRRGGKISNRKLFFIIQLYMLYLAGSKRIYVVVEDEQKGMGVYEFDRFKKEQRQRRYDSAQAENMISNGTMVLGNKEMLDWMSHLNGVSISPAMKYALRIKNSTAAKIASFEDETNYLVSLLTRYEGNKKKIIRQKDVTISDMYVLFYLYDGREKKATPCYKLVYLDAVNSSRQQILDAFKRMTLLGYVTKMGKGKNTFYKITAIGKTLVNELLKKYIVP